MMRGLIVAGLAVHRLIQSVVKWITALARIRKHENLRIDERRLQCASFVAHSRPQGWESGPGGIVGQGWAPHTSQTHTYTYAYSQTHMHTFSPFIFVPPLPISLKQMWVVNEVGGSQPRKIREKNNWLKFGLVTIVAIAPCLPSPPPPLWIR